MTGELRCEMCGKPALHETADAILCVGCADVWTVNHCECCGVRMMSSFPDRPDGSPDGLCSFCRMRARLKEVPESDRERILNTTLKRGKLSGILEARQLLGWPLREAVLAVEVLYSSGDGQA
jgi:hypothetical protein